MKTKTIVSIVGVIIVIIVLFMFLGQSAPELVGAADSIAYPSNCSGYSADANGKLLVLNPAVSVANCSNSSAQATGLVATVYNIPLRSLFQRAGIVVIIFMAMFLVLIIALSFSIMKKK